MKVAAVAELLAHLAFYTWRIKTQAAAVFHWLIMVDWSVIYAHLITSRALAPQRLSYSLLLIDIDWNRLDFCSKSTLVVVSIHRHRRRLQLSVPLDDRTSCFCDWQLWTSWSAGLEVGRRSSCMKPCPLLSLRPPPVPCFLFPPFYPPFLLQRTADKRFSYTFWVENLAHHDSAIA